MINCSLLLRIINIGITMAGIGCSCTGRMVRDDGGKHLLQLANSPNKDDGRVHRAACMTIAVIPESDSRSRVNHDDLYFVRRSGCVFSWSTKYSDTLCFPIDQAELVYYTSANAAEMDGVSTPALEPPWKDCRTAVRAMIGRLNPHVRYIWHSGIHDTEGRINVMMYDRVRHLSAHIRLDAITLGNLFNEYYDHTLLYVANNKDNTQSDIGNIVWRLFHDSDERDRQRIFPSRDKGFTLEQDLATMVPEAKIYCLMLEAELISPSRIQLIDGMSSSFQKPVLVLKVPPWAINNDEISNTH